MQLLRLLVVPFMIYNSSLVLLFLHLKLCSLQKIIYIRFYIHLMYTLKEGNSYTGQYGGKFLRAYF